MKFGEYLVENGVVNEEALRGAIQTQKYRPMKVGRILRDLGHLSQSDLDKSLKNFLKVRVLKTVEEAMIQIKGKTYSDLLGEILQNEPNFDSLNSPNIVNEILKTHSPFILPSGKRTITSDRNYYPLIRAMETRFTLYAPIDEEKTTTIGISPDGEQHKEKKFVM